MRHAKRSPAASRRTRSARTSANDRQNDFKLSFSAANVNASVLYRIVSHAVGPHTNRQTREASSQRRQTQTDTCRQSEQFDLQTVLFDGPPEEPKSSTRAKTSVRLPLEMINFASVPFFPFPNGAEALGAGAFRCASSSRPALGAVAMRWLARARCQASGSERVGHRFDLGRCLPLPV